MTIAAKVTTTTLAAGSVVVVGCYAGGLFEGEVEWHSLTEDDGFTNTYSNKVGGKYGMYLTGVTNPANKAWWIKTHKMYVSDVAEDNSGPKPLSKHFAKDKIKLDLAYSTSEAKALNKVCEEAYKKDLANHVDFSSPSGEKEEKHKLAEDILRYCSPLVEKPSTIQDSDANAYTGTNMIGKTKGKDKKLVKITGNDRFWRWQNEWFKKQGSTSLDNYFGKFFKVEGSSKVLKGNQTIRQICEVAYTKEAIDNATEEQPKIDDVVKYCSFEKTTSH